MRPVTGAGVCRRAGSVLAICLLLFSCQVATATSGCTLDLRRIRPLHGDAVAGKAKATACMGCHGAAGVAPVPAFPNLAGQHAEYLYWQLVAFKREARADSPMTALAAPLDDAAMRDLAAYFASLPAAVPDAMQDASSVRGARVYHGGDAGRGIPPCQGCHGVDGRGSPLAEADARWRAYPVLRGQHADYIVQRLAGFHARTRGASTSACLMQGVARNLDDNAMRDIAAWLQAGRP